MENIKLSVESFKFLIYNKFLPVFDEEINMNIADEILDNYEHITIYADDCIFGLNQDRKEFIKHKNNCFSLLKKIMESKAKTARLLD